MEKYKFKAKDDKNKIYKGILEVSSVDELRKILAINHYKLLKSKVVKDNKLSLDVIEEVKKRDVDNFCEKLYMLVSSGIQLEDAISIIANSVTNKKFQKVLFEIHKDITKGKSLSDAMNNFPKVFPEFLRNMIKVAEVSGKLNTVLKYVIEYNKDETKIKKKIISAMTYPILLLCFSIVVMIVLSVFIIPNFIEIFKTMNLKLPLITKIVIGVSSFINKYYIFILLLIALMIFGIVMLSKNEKIKYQIDKFKLKCPFFRKINQLKLTNRFCKMLRILNSSGLTLIYSIQLINNFIGNLYLSDKLKFAHDEIKRGQSLSKALETTNFFPKMFIELLKISEKSSQLDYALDNISVVMEDELSQKVHKITIMIEPLFIIFILLIVFVVVASVFLPIFTMMDNIGGM